MKTRPQNKPEPGRKIRLIHDGLKGTVGEWVPYKGSEAKRRGKGSGRFMAFDNKYGLWDAQVALWLDADSWEYVDEKETT